MILNQDISKPPTMINRIGRITRISSKKIRISFDILIKYFLIRENEKINKLK